MKRKGLPTKRQLQQRVNSPLLHLLLFDLRFRLVLLALVLIPAALLLFIWPLFRSTPKGFEPRIRVSALDRMQASSLIRRARTLHREGEISEANAAWRAAIANNPGNAAVIREFLQHLPIGEGTRLNELFVMQNAAWLLQLSQTNLLDVELAAEVAEGLNRLDQLRPLLDRALVAQSPRLQVVNLRYVMFQGRLGEFQERWSQRPEEEWIQLDPTLAVFRQAYLQWHDPAPPLLDPRFQLQETNSVHKGSLLRLQLALSRDRGDAESYGRALRKLQEMQTDTLPVHLAYWDLLDKLGRQEEVPELMESCTLRPYSVGEAVELLRRYHRHGMREAAFGLLSSGPEALRRSLAPWLETADALIEQRDWKSLLLLCTQMNRVPDLNPALASYRHFLEGRAHAGMGRHQLAEESFQHFRSAPLTAPTLICPSASDLLSLGYPRLARDLLAAAEDSFSDDLIYWQLLISVSDAMKDASLLLRSAERAFALNPNDPVAITGLAAGLLLLGKEPARAIQLTLRLIAQDDNLLSARINHAEALIANHRAEEARTLLDQTSIADVPTEVLSVVRLAKAKAALATGDWHTAVTEARNVVPHALYPEQLEHLQEILQMAPEATPNG